MKGKIEAQVGEHKIIFEKFVIPSNEILGIFRIEGKMDVLAWNALARVYPIFDWNRETYSNPPGIQEVEVTERFSLSPEQEEEYAKKMLELIVKRLEIINQKKKKRQKTTK